MRYLHVRLSSERATLHPLVATLTDETLFRDVKMVDWSFSRTPPTTTVLLYADGDVEALGRALEETDLVSEYDVTSMGAERGYAFVTSEPHPVEWELFSIGASEGLLTVSPVQYHHDGSISVRVLGSLDRLKSAIADTPEGVKATIERVGEYNLGRPPLPPRLSVRQREALVVASELGYYDVPRRATRDDVADRMECAPSTATEHLQKAERRLVETYVDATR
jgi:hypothetical protein